MRTLAQIVGNLDNDQRQLLVDTINHGGWGDTDTFFKGEKEPVRVYGYITDLAHKGNHFERRSLSNRFKELFKALGLKGNSKSKASDVMQWIYDWWEDGSGSILLVREELTGDLEKWAKNYNLEA